MLPASQVHVLEEDLDLAADEKALEGGVVEVHVLDVDLLQLFDVALDPFERRLHVAELTLDRQGERRDSAFHALEDIDAQEVDQAFLAVHLPEKARAALNLRAVLLVVGFLLVVTHVAQRRIGGEVQPA